VKEKQSEKKERKRKKECFDKRKYINVEK